MPPLAALLILLASCGPVVMPAGVPATEPHLTPGALVVRDGARLPLRSWPPARGNPVGIVIALHGFADYGAAFERIGPWLADQGFHAFAYDQRGFGAAPHPGIWPGTDALVGDLADVMTAVRHEVDGNLPVYLLGESMGGSVAMVAAAGMTEDRPAGLILAAPGVRGELPYRRLWDALFWTAAHLTPGFTVSVSRDPDDLLIAAASRRLRHDPLVIHDIRADSYHGVVRLADRASVAAADIRVPVLMLHGGRDALIRRVSICAAFELLPAAKTLRLHPEAPHLLLHWRQQERVLAEVAAWLADPSRTAASTDAAQCELDEQGGSER